MPVGAKLIRNRFGYHPGTPETIPQHEKAREAFDMFANFLDQLVPDGRAKSTAMTKLQECSMWTNFGIAEQSPVENPIEDATDPDPQYQ